MRRTLASLALLAAAGLAAVSTASAQDGYVAHSFDGDFEDAAFAVEQAIVGRGLVIDFVSHVGEMLARTKDDVGGEKALFEEADIYVFCSAVVSRKVMEADPMNISYCPYGIFVAERLGEGVQIGYRTYPDGPMDSVEDLLAEIVAEAISD